jgi:hypothetical protein
LLQAQPSLAPDFVEVLAKGLESEHGAALLQAGRVLVGLGGGWQTRRLSLSRRQSRGGAARVTEHAPAMRELRERPGRNQRRSTLYRAYQTELREANDAARSGHARGSRLLGRRTVRAPPNAATARHT